MATINQITITVEDSGAGAPTVTIDVELAISTGVFKHRSNDPDVQLTVEQRAGLATLMAGIRARVTEVVRAELVLTP